MYVCVCKGYANAAVKCSPDAAWGSHRSETSAMEGSRCDLVDWPKHVKSGSGGCLERSGDRMVTVSESSVQI